MSKAQNKNMGRKIRQGNMTIQKVHNNITEDLMKSKNNSRKIKGTLKKI
jgi:hypothetical protein